MELQWPLILFTTLTAWGCGVFGGAGALALKDAGKKSQQLLAILSCVLLAAGGIAVFFHLQHWERIFNGFGHITSGITLEFIGVIVFMICLAVFFLMGRRAEDGEAPKWCGVFAMIVGAGMTAVTGDSYLMPALPVWDTPLLVVFYLCNMLAMGGIALLIIGAAVKSVDGEDFASKTALVGLAVQLVVLIAYAASITFGADSYAELGMYFDPTLPDVAMVDVAAVVNVLGGTYAPMFWAGAIVLGTIVPAVVVFLGKKANSEKKLGFYIAAIVCLMAGGIMWRCITYLVALHAFATF